MTPDRKLRRQVMTGLAGGLALALTPGAFQALRSLINMDPTIARQGRRLLKYFSRRLKTYPTKPIAPAGIVVHHSATPPDRLAYANAAAFDREHQARGMGIWYQGRLYHIAYHYVILPDGAIEPGRPEKCPGAHTRSSRFNRWIGICLVGYFEPIWKNKKFHRPTPKQMNALVLLSADLMERYNFDEAHILPHRAINPTLCPGRCFPLREYFARLRAEALERRTRSSQISTMLIEPHKG